MDDGREREKFFALISLIFAKNAKIAFSTDIQKIRFKYNKQRRFTDSDKKVVVSAAKKQLESDLF